MKYTVCTTFNADGYAKYGQRMIQTFLQNWPCDLIVYAEDCAVAESSPRLFVRHTCDIEPLTVFKLKWQGVAKATGNVSNDPVRSKRRDAGKGFKWDAVRFSHKVYTVFHCAKNTNADWLLWMDADTVCHSPIGFTDLQRLCPPDRDLCFLGRRNKYSECGLYALNLKSSQTQKFLQQFQHYYDHAEQGIFTLDEWHDSYVFDAIRKLQPLKELDWSSHLITGEGHPLINSEWGAYLDHLKGSRKSSGRSLLSDLKVKRTEAYWQ